jgi:hypothetical protein
MKRLNSLIAPIIMTSLLFGNALALADYSQKASEPPPPTKVQVQEDYGKLPLHFEANRGQTDQQVQFLSRGTRHTIFLTPSEAVLVMAKAEQPAHHKVELGAKVTPTVLRMTFAGANPQPQVIGREELPGKANYFIGNDPSKWQTNVPTYGKVHYQDLYPGIDLIYYGNQRLLEYDLVIRPGVDPQIIHLRYEGVENLESDAQGDLVLRTAAGAIHQRKPFIYQEIDGVRREVS